jgi:hypothetical protein
MTRVAASTARRLPPAAQARFLADVAAQSAPPASTTCWLPVTYRPSSLTR